MTNAIQRLRQSTPLVQSETTRRRARSAAVLTVGLLDALHDVLQSDLDEDALLAAAARVMAGDLECLCMIERLVDGGARVVALAHPDPALTSRLRAAHQPAQIVSAERITGILARRAALSKTHTSERDAERYGVADLAGSLGLQACSFVAVPLTVRGQTLGVVWIIATRRNRILRPAEAESVARSASVIALALAAASAAGGARESTGTRRTILADR
jgi:GAF domain-containing protein